MMRWAADVAVATTRLTVATLSPRASASAATPTTSAATVTAYAAACAVTISTFLSLLRFFRTTASAARRIEPHSTTFVFDKA